MGFFLLDFKFDFLILPLLLSYFSLDHARMNRVFLLSTSPSMSTDDHFLFSTFLERNCWSCSVVYVFLLKNQKIAAGPHNTASSSGLDLNDTAPMHFFMMGDFSKRHQLLNQRLVQHLEIVVVPLDVEQVGEMHLSTLGIVDVD